MPWSCGPTLHIPPRVRVPQLAFTIVVVSSAHAFADRLTRIDPPGATDGEALKGNVLVWNDAKLYTEASDDAPAVHAASLRAARKDALGEVVPMHVVSVAKGFVEVEPADKVDCVWSRLQTSDDVAKL